MSMRLDWSRFGDIARRLPVEAGALVRTTAYNIEKRSKSSMRQAKHGRAYERGFTKSGRARKAHRASAPGEAPAIDTGALVNSIHTEFLTATSAVVYTNQEYAQALEYGSKRMAARPFFTPAAEISFEEMLESMSDIERRLGA